MIQRYTFTVLLIHIFSKIATAQAPVIQAVSPLSSTVERYGKFEVRLSMTAGFSNPYDYDEIRVTATFTAPDGQQTVVEGFYMDGFEPINPNTGNLTASPSGNGFRVRFSPQKLGKWSYTIACTNLSGTGSFPVQTFDCVSVANVKNKGFVHANGSNYLSFSNGEQYIPVGENIAWQQSNPYLDYKKWVSKMAENGGNFLRLWLCHWGIGLEWKLNSNGFSGLKKYKQSSAFYLDWLFDYCAERGVYVMFCLNHHGQVSSQVNPNWSENPYNSANGGPCATTADFFTNAQAKALHKNRLRYTLARWGYARSVMTWELFNEVNWTDNFDQNRSKVTAWHLEMAAFLKQRDYVARPVSSSFGDPQSEDPALWNDLNMDYSQRHLYFDSPNLEAILAAGIRENLNLFDKPSLIGEFGLNAANISLNALDPKGIHLHNNLWGPLFGGGLGTGMTWWWDSYIEPQNLYPHFAGVSTVAQQVAFREKDFRPVADAVVSGGAAGELKLNPSLGWAGLGDTLIQVSGDGTISPSNYKLGQFLYGSQWNTQYRRPPSFKVNMPQAGQFKVLIGSQLGSSPNLTVWLDGVKAVNTIPGANQTYTVNVPAGQHTLRVDNLGTDWATIAGYTFTGIGSALDAYVLKSADNTRLAAWILNSNYNHVFVKANGAPDAISGGVLTVKNVANGAYTAKWLDCQTGALLQSNPVTVSGGNLTVTVPDLVWDVALVVDATSADSETWLRSLPVSVSPNPISEGSLSISFFLENPANVEVELLNAGGVVVQRVFSGQLLAGEQRLSAQVPDGLPAGIYWLKLATGKYRAMKAVGVVR